MVGRLPTYFTPTLAGPPVPSPEIENPDWIPASNVSSTAPPKRSVLNVVNQGGVAPRPDIVWVNGPVPVLVSVGQRPTRSLGRAAPKAGTVTSASQCSSPCL